MRPKRPDLGPERVDYRPERADFRPERALGGLTDRRMDGRTKVPLYSTGLRSLRGRCPASSHSDLQPCNAGQRVLLTTDCPWPTSYRLKTGQEGEILPKQGLLWPVGPERAHFWFFDITLFFKRPYPWRIKSAHSFPITRPYISYPITRPHMMNTRLTRIDRLYS